jgi:hypothetical protein
VVKVKRGHARHMLVPSHTARYATLTEKREALAKPPPSLSETDIHNKVCVF